MKDTLIIEYKIKTGQIEDYMGIEKFILEFFLDKIFIKYFSVI